jgi:hypothetical protein
MLFAPFASCGLLTRQSFNVGVARSTKALPAIRKNSEFLFMYNFVKLGRNAPGARQKLCIRSQFLF